MLGAPDLATKGAPDLATKGAPEGAPLQGAPPTIREL
jgi:hypothetical protein